MTQQQPASSDTAEQSRLDSFQQLSRRIPVSPRTLRTWISKGIIPAIRPGKSRRMLFYWPDVERALRRFTTGGIEN